MADTTSVAYSFSLNSNGSLVDVNVRLCLANLRHAMSQRSFTLESSNNGVSVALVVVFVVAVFVIVSFTVAVAVLVVAVDPVVLLIDSIVGFVSDASSVSVPGDDIICVVVAVVSDIDFPSSLLASVVSFGSVAVVVL